MAADRRADAADRGAGRTVAGSGGAGARTGQRTAAALLTVSANGSGLRIGGRFINSTGRSFSALAIDDDLAVAIEVAIMVALDHDGLVTIARLALTNHFTFPI